MAVDKISKVRDESGVNGVPVPLRRSPAARALKGARGCSRKARAVCGAALIHSLTFKETKRGLWSAREANCPRE